MFVNYLKNGNLPLHLACAAGDRLISQILCENGSRVNSHNHVRSFSMQKLNQTFAFFHRKNCSEWFFLCLGATNTVTPGSKIWGP